MDKEALKKLGLTDEQINAVLGEHQKELAPLNEKLKTAQDDLKLAQDKVAETEGKLKGLEGVDKEAYEKQISELQENLKNLETTHASELADRDFNDLLKESISSASGKNAKAITALLDIDALKASKNQKEDVEAALKALTEAEDSKMLFGEPEASPVGTGNIIGEVRKPSGNTEDAVMRAAMGLPPVAE